MSEQNPMNDHHDNDIDQPEVVEGQDNDAVEAPYSPTVITTKRKSRLGVVGLVAITTIVGGAWAFNEFGGEAMLTSKLARAPKNIDATPAGEQLASSPRYRATVQTVNTRGADEAASEGTSFIAVPDEPVQMLDIDEKPARKAIVRPKLPLPAANKKIVAPVVAQAVEPEPEPEPEPEVTAQEPEKVVEYRDRPVYYEVTREEPRESDYSDIDALADRMAAQAGSTGRILGNARSEIIIRQDLYTDPKGRSVGVNAGRPQPATPPLPVEESSLAIDAGTYGADPIIGMDYLTPKEGRQLPVASGVMPKNFNPYGFGPGGVFGVEPNPDGILATAGSVAYARIINATDTDTPGPIIAEVTSGDLEGARLIGSFTENRETTAMIIEFSQVVLDDGTIIPTSAYAVDALYGDLAVRSRYKPRYFQRYAPRLAGAFLRGAGAAIAQTGTTIVGVGDAAVVTSPEASAREAVAAGVADVGDQLASEIEELGPDRGLVELYANKPVGILWLANVRTNNG